MQDIKKVFDFNEQIYRLNKFFEIIMQNGMNRYGGACWPVVVRRWGDVWDESDRSNYIYQYPQIFFANISLEYNVKLFVKTKSNHINMLKFLVDQLMKNNIDIHLYHFGLFLLDSYSSEVKNEEILQSIGKKRSEFIKRIPRYELKSNDEFLPAIWSLMLYRRIENDKEILSTPLFKELRILFTAKTFGNHTGMHCYDADWIEPINGNELEVKKWYDAHEQLKLPTNEGMNEDMNEGPIILGQDGLFNGLRHFVNGMPVEESSHIQVKFGESWIAGRYEWSQKNVSSIRIYSSENEWVSIREGHIVRIKRNEYKRGKNTL